MNKLIDLFIEKTSWVNGISIGITLLGLISLWGIKRDLHPPFQFNYVVINSTYPSGSAEEIERLITYPIEEAVRDLPDLEEMTSKTRVGQSRITLKFPHSVNDISKKIEEIRARVQGETRNLPDDIKEISVTQANENEIFVASIGITGINSRNWSHHESIEFLQNQIKAIPGITQVSTSLQPYHIYIRFDADKLSRNGVTVAQIRQAVRSELDANSIGFTSIDGKDWLLEFSQKRVTPENIGNITLFKNGQGHGLKLKDVAKVEYDLERGSKYQFLLNGETAVEMTVFKSPDKDAMETFSEVQKVLNKSKLPDGIKTEVLYDGPYFIQQQISVLISNGFGGLLLVLVMLAFAMGWKTSLMTAIGLPISYFGTFLILRFFHISIDLISLIAMILVVGNLVDDAVIFAERYNQLLTDGLNPKLAASTAAKELIVPVTGTIATIICAFLPILFIQSELSIIFFAIPIVITVSLLLSWFETFFILPNHLQHYVTKPSAEHASRFFARLNRLYAKALAHILNFRYLYGLASIGFLGFSLWIASKMPQDFSLYINAPQVEIFVTFKDELSFEEVQKTLLPLHQKISKLPKSELQFIETNLGWVWKDGKSYRGPRYATIRLVLNKEQVDVKTLRDTVKRQVDQILKDFQSDQIQEIIAQSTERGSSARRQNLASIQIEGREEHSFVPAQNDIIAAIANKKDIGGYVPPDNRGPKTFQFFANNDALRAYQITKEDLGFQIQAQTGSVEVLQTRDSNRWIRIYLESFNLSEPELKDLKSLKIQSPRHDDLFQIENLGQWKLAGMSDLIEHQNGSRVLNLDFSFQSEKTNEQVIKSQMKELIQSVEKKYPELQFKVIDANEQDKKGRDWTGRIILASAILIYFILALTLRSWSQPLIVGLPIPFALIGVIWALKLHDIPMGLMSMIGLIGTMGVAVNDSIVMVHQINVIEKAKGFLNAEIIVEGAVSRLRAIFLTASCTLVGVFPTAYGVGGESGFTQPLAFSMGWGLSASLLLTLFIIPAMLMIFSDVKKIISRFVR